MYETMDVAILEFESHAPRGIGPKEEAIRCSHRRRSENYPMATMLFCVRMCCS